MPDTRALVVDTALRLFRERGYEATTMRLVAAEAGLSVGNAYYYFPGKDALVQELYRRIQVEHRAAVADRLPRGGTLEQRLTGTWLAGLAVMAPYRSFGAGFVSRAIRPGEAASPFSDASSEARELAVHLLRDVVEGARPAVPGTVARELPELLWLAWLGVTVFWLNDPTPDAGRTRRLVTGAAPLIGRLVRLSRLPVLRTTVTDVLALVEDVRR
ncbi:TetR family transcriptional regulator [Aquipuribacter nitratireducens]|uniref:TetR family transcriptional regulator n=1 Tax=Aquipuribacter nitratireducens TaxID=650104 RepID=A0ABW0GN03_9MICO